MEKVERFILKPRTQLFFGRTVNKEMEFDEWTEDKCVHQTLKDLVLTTIVDRKHESKYQTHEKAELTQVLPEGTILVWTEEAGYVVPEYGMTTAEEAIEDLKVLLEFSSKGDDVDDVTRNEKEGTEIN